MNEREQFEFENYLREFHPRIPRALIPVSQSQNWRRLAAAIAIFFLGSASIWNAFHHKERNVTAVKKIAEVAPQMASTIPLTRLALEDPDKFEATLDIRASKTLQKFDRPDSSLRVLAKQ